ncbi:MAG: hypothetical protein WAK56_11180, partial [Candidatus Sulfotelmatobacter sp.]
MKNIGGSNCQIAGLLSQVGAVPKISEPHNLLAGLSKLQPAWRQLMNPGKRFQGHSTASVQEGFRCRQPLLHLAIEDDFPLRLPKLGNIGP